MMHTLTTTAVSIALSINLMGCLASDKKPLIEPTQPPINISATANEASTLWATTLQEPIEEATEELQEEGAKRDSLARALNLAQMALAANKLKEARQFAREALTHDIKNDKARIIMAHAYYREKLVDLAEIALNGITPTTANTAPVYNLRALISLERKRPADALALFKKGLERDAANAAIRMNLGILYLSFRQIRPAARQFERVLKDYPAHTDAMFHLAVARAAMGEGDYSRGVYEDVVSAIDNHAYSIFNIALLDADSERYGDAIEGLKRYLSTDAAKASNNTEIFALISEFENMKAAMARAPTDEEIQKMAAKAGPPAKTAAKSDDAFGYSDAPTQPTEPAAEPASSQSSPAQPKEQPKKRVNRDADLEMLEQELNR